MPGSGCQVPGGELDYIYAAGALYMACDRICDLLHKAQRGSLLSDFDNAGQVG